jgi:Mrp family chromosome partitioning ATPase
VLFSVLQGVSRIPKVQKAMHKITDCGARILGVVVNGTATEGLGYGSGYGNRYLDTPSPSTSPA